MKQCISVLLEKNISLEAIAELRSEVKVIVDAELEGLDENG